MPLSAPRPNGRSPARGAADPLREALAFAIEAGEIATVFQPKVSLATRTLIGVEALARWTSPNLGAVSPARFIPVAEEAGLIGSLTRIVLRDALAACAILRRRMPRLTVAVNISPVLLDDPGLPTEIDAALAEARLPPEALVAEITEGQAIQNIVRAGATLAALRARGISCAIDDFGTGHASLLSLLRLPFSELKIDRAFVAACTTDREAAMIVRATLGLAREMQLNVVAEGIETRATEALLRSLGCTSGQGYRYGRPAEAATILSDALSAEAASAPAPRIGGRPRQSPETSAPKHAQSTPRVAGKTGAHAAHR